MHKINIPDDLYMRIMEQAKKERRSVTGHLLCILDAHLGVMPEVKPAEPAILAKPTVTPRPVGSARYAGLAGDGWHDAWS